jgi:hypothetical protein
MTTLTNSSTFSIGAGTTTVESVSFPILPAISSTQGRGRLIHPTLGTYDYSHQPDKWKGIDGDLLVAPIWSYSKTLLGGANTLMTGHIRDVLCTEQWTFAIPIAHLRSLILFWMNPPDPDDGFVQWCPNYTSENGFYVAIVGLEVGEEEITLDWISQRHDLVISGVKISFRIIDRVV